MALVELPYPDMDFVPMDILTAEELDQMVANINAINGASISTQAIANEAVTPEKINTSQLFNFNQVTTEVGLASEKTRLTISGLVSGKQYILIAKGNFGLNEYTGNVSCGLHAYQGSTNIESRYTHLNGSINYYYVAQSEIINKFTSNGSNVIIKATSSVADNRVLSAKTEVILIRLN